MVSEGDWMPSDEMVILTDGLGTDLDLNGRHLNMPDFLWDNLESVDLPSFRKTGQKGLRGRFGHYSPEWASRHWC